MVSGGEGGDYPSPPPPPPTPNSVNVGGSGVQTGQTAGVSVYVIPSCHIDYHLICHSECHMTVM